MSDQHRIEIHAPTATRVWLEVHSGDGTEPVEQALLPTATSWVGAVERGARYEVRADGPGELGFDATRGLVDPLATQVWIPPGHSREAARPGSLRRAPTPLAEAVPWPSRRASRRTTRPLVVYETHVRGFTKRRQHEAPGTFAALCDELPRLADLGVSVVELMPVHQFDPDEGNYWGYMPLVLGAIHRAYAASRHPAQELADLVEAAHDLDIEVWADVVVNHTTEEDANGPTYNLRGLADSDYYVRAANGDYANDAGTGNIIDAASPAAQRLITTSLDRLADLGLDGFRFDLAAVLTRDPDFVRSIGDWAERRRVRLVAEPWDLRRYLLGRPFPDPRWAQWNDRFRDDMRGFLRGEGGLVASVMQRIQGSPDFFDRPDASINFLTAHDGYTMYDLVSYERKHNEANGEGNRDGAHDNRSWNCGWEGDDIPGRIAGAVMSLRRQQLRNAMTLLMLSQGTPMFVAGDEFARTQGGNNNPYNQDNETSWVDWDRSADFAEHESFVRSLIAFRAAHPVLWQDEPWGDRIEWFGTSGPPDLAGHSRSLAWHLGDPSGADLYVLANMWWEALQFELQASGPWRVVLDTSLEIPASQLCGSTQRVPPRSIIVLRRERESKASSPTVS